MPDTVIAIDRIEIDLRGVDPGVAQAALASLGPALGAALTRHPPAREQGGGRPQPAPVTVRLGRSPTAAEVRDAVVARVADAVRGRADEPLTSNP